MESIEEGTLPGGRRINYDFPNGPPVLLKIVFVVYIVNFVTDFAIGIWASRWAPRQPSSNYPYPIRFKGGVVAYVPPAIGHYEIWGFWSGFVLLAFIALLFWYYENIGRAVRVR
jgi:hypothetical protein